jgi:hypothetical protein
MADKMSGKGVKINTTSEIPAGGVLDSTLAAQEQWDMNKMNDPIGMHPEFNGPKQIKDKN